MLLLGFSIFKVEVLNIKMTNEQAKKTIARWHL